MVFRFTFNLLSILIFNLAYNEERMYFQVFEGNFRCDLFFQVLRPWISDVFFQLELQVTSLITFSDQDSH